MAARKRKNAYSPKNPKIDIYWLDGGGYIASTRWSNTLKEAKAKAEKKYGKGKVGVEFDRDFNDRHFLKGGTPRKGKKMAARKRKKNNPRRYMTKKEFESYFKRNVMPSILKGEMERGSGFPDAAGRRMAWNDMVDSLQKGGQINPSANWMRPDWVESYGYKEALRHYHRYNPVDWRGAGRKAWGGAKGAAAKAAHAAKLAKAKTKVRAAESKIKSLKSCAVDLDVFPSELASTKSMKTAQRALTTAKSDVKKIQAEKPKAPKKIKGGTPPKGQEEDVSWYLYSNPGKGRKSTKRRIAKKNAPTRRTNARNPTYKKGDRVYVTDPSYGKPFYGTVVGTMISDGEWRYPKGTKLYAIGRSPTSGASWYTVDQFRATKGGRGAAKPAYYASFTEAIGRRPYTRYYIETSSYGEAQKWIDLWETHPSKKRLSVSGSRPRSATDLTKYNPRKKASTRRKNAGMNEVRVKFKNSKYNYTTAVSANTTHRQAYEYFVGQYVDVAPYPNENMQKVVGIDYNGREVDPPGWAEKWLAGKDPRYPVAPHHRIFVGGAKSNPRKKAPKSRKNAMATKKLSSFRGDKRRVAKGMMTKGYRYYIKAPRVPGMYAKSIKMATELVKDYGPKGVKVYKLVK